MNNSNEYNETSTSNQQIDFDVVFRIILLSCWCALMAGIFLWSIHPIAYQKWELMLIPVGMLWCSGPFVLFVISIYSLIFGSRSSRLIKRATLIHFGLSLLGAILSWIVDQYLGFDMVIFFIFTMLAALIDLPILLFLPGNITHPKEIKILHVAVVLSIGGTITGMFLWSALNIKIVQWRALSIADEQPYCIKVPEEGGLDYKPATQRKQLSGLWMHTPYIAGGGSSDFQFVFHSVLVVGKGEEKQFYNWSYYAQNFVPITGLALTYASYGNSCEPITGFFDTLQ